MNRVFGLFVGAGLAFGGCGGGTHVSVQPVRNNRILPAPPVVEAKAPRESPPESFPARPFAAPPATWAELGNGLKIVSRRDKSVPIAHVRIAVLAGSSVDGESTGLSAVCGRALASSGAGTLSDTELQAKLETLGASLDVDVDADRIVVGLSVVSNRLPEAFDVLAQMVTKPRLGKDDVIRVQKRLAEEAADNARGDGRWGALMVLYRDLFSLPAEHHPYASYDATADEISAIKPADCKNWHRRFFVPNNMLVAASGDVDPSSLRAAAQRGLGGLRKGSAPLISFTDPMPPGSTKITLVDRPGSAQSEVAVGTLASKKSDSSYASFLVADQVIGGTYTGRIFTDMREKRGLAYLSFSQTYSHANSPSVFYMYAQTQNGSTGEALGALLDHAAKMVGSDVSPEENETASRFLAGWRALESGVPGREADMLCDAWVHKESDDAEEERAKAIRQTTPDSVRKAFAEHVRPGHFIIVVAGDAAQVGAALQPFGEVKVVDPTRNFARIKTLPATKQ